ncbi:sensor histidine kinase [Brotaphodocola sp.]|uniref:sensor histidine kinase n=1 Tax=Brotaphodocola sp. TaxID=3073577 RepID=UPI003D7E53D0
MEGENSKKSQSRVFTANRFINQLQHAVTRRLVFQIALGMMLFVLAFFSMTYVSNREKAEKNLEMLRTFYLKLYEQSMDFLNDEDVLQAYLERWKDPESTDFEYLFNRFNTKSVIENKVILIDADGALIDTTFAENELSDYLSEYNRAVCYNVKNMQTKEVYVTVFSDTGRYSDYLFIRPVYEGETLRGFISMFLIGSEWNFYLSDKNYDGVIIDDRCNVIYRSKAGFANQSGKFYPKSGKIGYYNEERYWVEREYLPEYRVTIYSLVYYPTDNTLLIGMCLILLLGLLWYSLARWMSRTMAEYNATQLSHLVREIRKIQDGDHEHRIHMNTNDEYDEVAHRINRMLDSVRELNDRNSELIVLNATLERGQLEAQMNPHFLYNTLEIIRNLVMFDGEKAEELIERLVHILRYSVSNSRRDLRLEEDLEYIQDYLYIQEVRFGDRFSCELNFDPEALACIVPKLLLQPVIENSIKYGFRVRKEIHVWIEGCVEENILTIRAKDDGPGMDQEKLDQLSASLQDVTHTADNLGLHNIARRICLQYGERSGMKIQNRQGGGFEVEILIDQTGNRIG